MNGVLPEIQQNGPWGYIWRKLRPPRRLSATTLGRLVIVFTILIGVAAINTGNNLLYLILGNLFGLVAASGVLSERVLKKIHLRFHFPDVVFARHTVLIPIELESKKSVSSFLIEVQLIDVDKNIIGTTLVRELLPYEKRTINVAVTFETRGITTIYEVRLTTRFPFQMYEKSRVLDLPPTRIYIAPEPMPVGKLTAQHKFQGNLMPSTTKRGDDEFYQLRQRDPSDPPSRIHWKRAAQTGEHFVKLFSDQQDFSFSFELCQGQSDTEFEQALSILSGFLQYAKVEAIELEIRLGEKLHSIHQNDHYLHDIQIALETIAMIQRQQVPPGLPALKRS